MPRSQSKRIRDPPARKKACKQCTQAKVRCGHEKPQCGRCAVRQQTCEYFNEDINSPGRANALMLSTIYAPTSRPGYTSISPKEIFVTPEVSTTNLPDHGISTPISVPQSLEPSSDFQEVRDVDFKNLDLVPFADSSDIQNRWITSFFSPGAQIPKNIHPHTVQYVACVLRSYPKYMLHDKGVPPIIHPKQVGAKWLSEPLANCYSLVRLWEGCVQGSETMIANTVKQEMERLVSEHGFFNDIDLLAAFQAYLMYTLLAFFSPIGDNHLVDHTILVNLQELAARVSANGLMSSAELRRSRPRWESWLIAAAKRRTLHTMYLFNNVFNALNDVPTYIAAELKNLPISSNKPLWEASDRISWEREYDSHLSAWTDGEMVISELWRSSNTGTPAQRDRIDRWLRTVDEFGMMLFATTAHLHGC